MTDFKRESLRDSYWTKQGIGVPQYNISEVVKATAEATEWLHIGPGNIFRGYVAGLQNELLNQGKVKTGIAIMSPADPEKLHMMQDNWDLLTLQVILEKDGAPSMNVIASVTEGVAAAEEDGWARAREIAAMPSLQLITYTITEKGYNLRDLNGEYTELVQSDIDNGPERPYHTMATTAALLLDRFKAGGHPVTLVSMDNFSNNGDKVRAAVLEIAKGWAEKDYVDADFIAWLQDPAMVGCPIAVIDKIVPRPDSKLGEALEARGMKNMVPRKSSKGSVVAPYVNTEKPEYLLIENIFPNGRPPLEDVGVYITDRETVDQFEQMKVSTCLNPLHTALAVTGTLLRKESIADCMQDEDLVRLVRQIGYSEGLPVVVNPGIISPKDFLDEVVEERLPNPNIPDTPQRIAMDTSQKVGMRFGKTIQAYLDRPDLDVKNLKAIPLVLAFWIFYLLEIGDDGEQLEITSDPLKDELQAQLADIEFGKPDSVAGNLEKTLSNKQVFGVDLVEAGLAPQIEEYVTRLVEGPGQVRKLLQEVLNNDDNDENA